MPIREFGPNPWGEAWRPDPDVEGWCSFLIDLIGADEWDRRRSDIHSHLRELAESGQVDSLHSREWVPSDTAAWHIYVCETYVRSPTEYPVGQGARHIPVVKSLTRDWPSLQNIEGLEERLVHALKSERDHFDAALFELLVAVAYLRAGRGQVQLVSPRRDEPSPDVLVSKDGEKLWVECKRKSRISDYAKVERNSWLRLFAPVREWMVSKGAGWGLHFTFHVPINDLPENWLADKVLGRLRLASPGVVIDDAELTLRMEPVDLGPIEAELEHLGIRIDGSRLGRLLFGEFPPDHGVTPAVSGTFRRNAPHVLDEISFACGGIWSCDAPEATEAKARYLHRDLAEAVGQIPAGEIGAVHWGVDIYSGERVKQEVYKRTVSAVEGFDLGDRNVEWVYAHIFDFLLPPDGLFDVHEDVHYFRQSGGTTPMLEPPLVLVPDQTG